MLLSTNRLKNNRSSFLRINKHRFILWLRLDFVALPSELNGNFTSHYRIRTGDPRIMNHFFFAVSFLAFVGRVRVEQTTYEAVFLLIILSSTGPPTLVMRFMCLCQRMAIRAQHLKIFFFIVRIITIYVMYF